MISAKEIKLKIFLNAVKEFRKAVRHGELNQDETVAKWWKFTGGIFERLVSSGTAKMRFQIFSPDLVVDVWDQTNKGVNFQVLLSGRGHLIGMWLDMERKTKVVGYRRNSHYLAHFEAPVVEVEKD